MTYDEIRARHESDWNDITAMGTEWKKTLIFQERAWLLAEVERLKNAVRGAMDDPCPNCDELTRQRNHYRTMLLEVRTELVQRNETIDLMQVSWREHKAAHDAEVERLNERVRILDGQYQSYREAVSAAPPVFNISAPDRSESLMFAANRISELEAEVERLYNKEPPHCPTCGCVTPDTAPG